MGRDGKEMQENLTNRPDYGMISVVKERQRVLSVSGRRGNQVRILNDPVTVSGKRYR